MPNETAKVWLLTGLAEPLARTVEQQLNKEGHRVVCAGRDKHQYDPRDAASWDALFAATATDVGPVDVVVLGVAADTNSPLEDMSLEQFKADNETNLIGNFLGVQAAFKAFEGRGGRIVTLASVDARAGKGSSPTLSTGSGGVGMLTRAAAVEGAGHSPRIYVNGALANNPTQWPGANVDSNVSLDEIADAVIFLGGPGADYMAGSLVPIGAPGP